MSLTVSNVWSGKCASNSRGAVHTDILINTVTHVPERLWGRLVLLGALYQVFDLFTFYALYKHWRGQSFFQRLVHTAWKKKKNPGRTFFREKPSSMYAVVHNKSAETSAQWLVFLAWMVGHSPIVNNWTFNLRFTLVAVVLYVLDVADITGWQIANTPMMLFYDMLTSWQ